MLSMVSGGIAPTVEWCDRDRGDRFSERVIGLLLKKDPDALDPEAGRMTLERAWRDIRRRPPNRLPAGGRGRGRRNRINAKCDNKTTVRRHAKSTPRRTTGRRR